MFEKWRKIWDDIIAEQLPKVDEMLLTLEENIDKFLFNQVKQTHNQIESKLMHIDEQIQAILDELTELLDSKKKNKEEMEELIAKQSHAEKKLLTERHTFGKSAELLDQTLQSTAEQIASYEQLTAEGNYLKARELVLTIKASLDPLMIKMEKIPQLLKQCKTVIPAQKKELANGYEEMKVARICP